MINKITVGFVIQTFTDDGQKCVKQEFCAGDDVAWEDEYLKPIECPENAQYQPFHMCLESVEIK